METTAADILLSEPVNNFSENNINTNNTYRGNSDESSLNSDTDESSSCSSLSSFHEEEEVTKTKNSSTKACPYKTKGELSLDDLPKIEELNISVPESDLKAIGKISGIVDQQLVIASFKNSTPLDIDSILFLSNGTPIGKIFDVFGPVVEPLYSIRFNSADDIKKKNFIIDDIVYYAPENNEVTSYVFVDSLRNQKGSDASWTDNNEPPEDCLDYSDDEQERRFRQKNRAKSRNSEIEVVNEVNKKKPAIASFSYPNVRNSQMSSSQISKRNSYDNSGLNSSVRPRPGLQWPPSGHSGLPYVAPPINFIMNNPNNFPRPYLVSSPRMMYSPSQLQVPMQNSMNFGFQPQPSRPNWFPSNLHQSPLSASFQNGNLREITPASNFSQSLNHSLTNTNNGPSSFGVGQTNNSPLKNFENSKEVRTPVKTSSQVLNEMSHSSASKAWQPNSPHQPVNFPMERSSYQPLIHQTPTPNQASFMNRNQVRECPPKNAYSVTPNKFFSQTQSNSVASTSYNQLNVSTVPQSNTFNNSQMDSTKEISRTQTITQITNNQMIQSGPSFPLQYPSVPVLLKSPPPNSFLMSPPPSFINPAPMNTNVLQLRMPLSPSPNFVSHPALQIPGPWTSFQQPMFGMLPLNNSGPNMFQITPPPNYIPVVQGQRPSLSVQSHIVSNSNVPLFSHQRQPAPQPPVSRS